MNNTKENNLTFNYDGQKCLNTIVNRIMVYLNMNYIIEITV